MLASLSTRLPSDHALIQSNYMAAYPVNAKTPTTLRITSTKPKPATFAKEGWYKEAAKRKLFLFDLRQSGEETLPIYSLSSRSPWEWDGAGPGPTVPSAYAAKGLLVLPKIASSLAFTRVTMDVRHGRDHTWMWSSASGCLDMSSGSPHTILRSGGS